MFGSRSGRTDLEPNIFPSGPPTQSVSTQSYFPVLWLRQGDLKALELRTEIMQRLMEREPKQAKETVIIYKFIVYID